MIVNCVCLDLARCGFDVALFGGVLPYSRGVSLHIEACDGTNYFCDHMKTRIRKGKCAVTNHSFTSVDMSDNGLIALAALSVISKIVEQGDA